MESVEEQLRKWILAYSLDKNYSNVVKKFSFEVDMDSLLKIRSVMNILHHIIGNMIQEEFPLAISLLENVYTNFKEQISYKNYSKSIMGVKCLSLLHILEHKPNMSLSRLNAYFPREGLAQKRKVTNKWQEKEIDTQIQFRKFFLKLIANPKEKESYFTKKYERDFGTTFKSQHQQVVSKLLTQVQNALPKTEIHQMLISGPHSALVQKLASFKHPKIELYLDILYEHFDDGVIPENEIFEFLHSLSNINKDSDGADIAHFIEYDSSPDSDDGRQPHIDRNNMMLGSNSSRQFQKQEKTDKCETFTRSVTSNNGTKKRTNSPSPSRAISFMKSNIETNEIKKPLSRRRSSDATDIVTKRQKTQCDAVVAILDPEENKLNFSHGEIARRLTNDNAQERINQRHSRLDSVQGKIPNQLPTSTGQEESDVAKMNMCLSPPGMIDKSLQVTQSQSSTTIASSGSVICLNKENNCDSVFAKDYTMVQRPITGRIYRMRNVTQSTSPLLPNSQELDRSINGDVTPIDIDILQDPKLQQEVFVCLSPLAYDVNINSVIKLKDNDVQSRENSEEVLGPSPEILNLDASKCNLNKSVLPNEKSSERKPRQLAIIDDSLAMIPHLEVSQRLPANSCLSPSKNFQRKFETFVSTAAPSNRRNVSTKKGSDVGEEQVHIVSSSSTNESQPTPEPQVTRNVSAMSEESDLFPESSSPDCPQATAVNEDYVSDSEHSSDEVLTTNKKDEPRSQKRFPGDKKKSASKFTYCHLCGRKVHNFLIKTHTCRRSLSLKLRSKMKLRSSGQSSRKNMKNPHILSKNTRTDLVSGDNDIAPENVLQCSVCYRILSSKKALDGHVKLHHQTDQHHCQYCYKTFENVAKSAVHMKTHITRGENVCIVCSKTFRSRAILKEHSYIHAETKFFHCVKCKTAFQTGWQLRKHKNICIKNKKAN